MPTFRYDHVHLRSPDPEKSASFYVEMLGGKRTGQQVQPNGALRVLLEVAGLPMFIEQVPPETPGTPKAPFLGLEHIGLVVDGPLEPIIEELRSKGVTIAMEPTTPKPGLRIAFIEGPEKVRIELLDRNAA